MNNWYSLFIIGWLVFTACIISIKLVGKARGFLKRLPKPGLAPSPQSNAAFASAAKSVVGGAFIVAFALGLTLVAIVAMPHVGFTLTFGDLLLIWFLTQSRAKC